MAEIHETRLRYVRAKTPGIIVSYVNNLPYRIETKGGIVKDGKKYMLTFILPEKLNLKEAPSGDLE